ncbi:hypothetical protein QRX60_35500 [Amycolatopsis mongoliensis]|uniref:Uncharacterized protein n=1 Tax=Amycolatopsis mongoliensis TaxID=715475 RepID=A0A9Y2NH49_9PSEU|nr:hypothetical protein [Amycolatopsis sp. 4-36]WIX99327.1 hypothetical protein QRX60_35500 [Amycolatopsis sp. 4-36]
MTTTTTAPTSSTLRRYTPTGSGGGTTVSFAQRTEPVYIDEAACTTTEPIMFKVTCPDLPAGDGHQIDLVAYVPAGDPDLPRLQDDQHYVVEPVDHVPAAYLVASGILASA